MTNEEKLEAMYKDIEQAINKLVQIQKNVDEMRKNAENKNKL